MNTIDVSSIDIDRKRDAQRRGGVAQLFRTRRTGKNGLRFNRSCENKNVELLPQKDRKQKYFNEDYIF